MTAKKASATGKAPRKQGTSAAAAQARRAVFVEAYIANGGNATEAAVTAGFSPATARSKGSQLLTDVNVIAQINSRRGELVKKYELTTEMVTRSIVQELNFDPGALYREDGSLRSVQELDEDARMVLTSLEFEQIGTLDGPVFVRKVKWAPRHQAREQAMKFLGMFEKDNIQRSPLSGESLQMLLALKAQLQDK